MQKDENSLKSFSQYGRNELTSKGPSEYEYDRDWMKFETKFEKGTNFRKYFPKQNVSFIVKKIRQMKKKSLIRARQIVK